MAKRMGSRDLSQSRAQRQSRTRGRIRTEVVREGLSDLDAAPVMLFSAGARNVDPDPDDVQDGDLLLQESEAGDFPLEILEADDADDGEAAPEFSLKEVLGSRPPVTLLQVRCPADQAEVKIVAQPASAAAADALEELCDLVETCFRQGRETLSNEEWQRLMGRQPAPILDRLLLLARLAISGRTGKCKPIDRGLKLYVNKFASLPDGTPFGIRLLLLDERGRPDPHPFKQLPMTVKLVALLLALEEEKREGRAYKDNDFRDKLQEALETLGIHLDEKPTQDQVINLRVTLQREGLGELFPKASMRQQAYAAA